MRTIYDRKSRCIKYFEYFLPYAHRAANGAMSLLFDKSPVIITVAVCNRARRIRAPEEEYC